jgi:hypothetical protein
MHAIFDLHLLTGCQCPAPIFFRAFRVFDEILVVGLAAVLELDMDDLVVVYVVFMNDVIVLTYDDGELLVRFGFHSVLQQNPGIERGKV